MTEREKQDFLQGEKQTDAPPPKKMKSEDLLMRSGGYVTASCVDGFFYVVLVFLFGKLAKLQRKD